MRLDLRDLKDMHPLLPAETAAEYAHRGAVGLERHGHAVGVVMPAELDEDRRDAFLHWEPPAPGDGEQLDRHRVTEDAAEAIALALVHVENGWVVRRRLQRGESADWLLRDPSEGLVALEVSGIGASEDPQRLTEKLEQVRVATVASRRVACVVELPIPRAMVATA